MKLDIYDLQAFFVKRRSMASLAKFGEPANRRSVLQLQWCQDQIHRGGEMVNDITRLMDHLQVRNAHVIGYSMGGGIVMKMLVEHPDRFLTAVIGANGVFRAEDLEEQASLTKYLRSGVSFSEAVIAAAPADAPPLSAEQPAIP